MSGKVFQLLLPLNHRHTKKNKNTKKTTLKITYLFPLNSKKKIYQNIGAPILPPELSCKHQHLILNRPSPCSIAYEERLTSINTFHYIMMRYLE